MRVIVAGCSAAGIFSALLLARAGHEVDVFDRDDLHPAPSVESAAASAFRATAPQIVQPHSMKPLFRQLMMTHLPDVYQGILDAGANESSIEVSMPASLADRNPRPGDDQLVNLATRRSTIDWVLRRAVVAEPGVTVHYADGVQALATEPGGPPHVTGVVTASGEYRADFVVDATGRRTRLDRWLADAGAAPCRIERGECGVAYYGRHYRITKPAALPGPKTLRRVEALEEFTLGIWPGDGDTMCLCVLPMVEDKRFRNVHRPEIYDAVVRSVPYFAGWLDAMEPITGIYAMGGLHNTLRHMVVDRRPVITGIHAIGDSLCTTNPTLGRGLSLAMFGAVHLVEALAEHAEDRWKLAIDLDNHVTESIEPFFRDQVQIDELRMAGLRHRVFGGPAPVATDDPDRVDYLELRAAAQYDPEVLRAFWHVLGMLRPPEDVYTNPDIVRRTRQQLAEHGMGVAIKQPTTQQLEAALQVNPPDE